MSSSLPWGMGDAYDVCGAPMCPWDMEGGVGAHWGPPVLSSMVSERIQRSEKGGEAGSDPRGHLGVTWGVYLCAGKPPLADIILSHPPDLTRCDSVIGLVIPAMSGYERPYSVPRRRQRRFIYQNIGNQQGFIIIMFP